MLTVDDVCMTAIGTDTAMPMGLLAMFAAVSAITLTVFPMITVGVAAVPI